MIRLNHNAYRTLKERHDEVKALNLELVRLLTEARRVAYDMRQQLLDQQAMPDDPGPFPWEKPGENRRWVRPDDHE